MNDKSSIEYLLDSLTERERSVIEKYYGVGNESIRINSLKELSNILNLHPERIRVAKLAALKKMRRKNNIQHARSISNPELFFDVFGESKECLHLKIYFESYFKNIEISNIQILEKAESLTNDMNRMEDRFNNFLNNISNILKGSELFKFLDEINRSSQNVGIEMASVCHAAESVKGACSSLVATFNKLLDKVEHE